MAKEISKANKFMLTLAVAALVPGSAIAAGDVKGVNTVMNNHAVQSAQQITSTSQYVLTGYVKDENGEPLIGVSVKVRNAKGGVVTDAEGKFSIVTNKDNVILVLSYVGMKTQEVRAKVGKKLNVIMQDDGHLIDETVVTGIYKRNKESFTGSVTTLRQEQLKEIGSMNILQSVAALEPSFQIMENNLMGADPNTAMNININGTNSINGLTDTYSTNPDQPLFILDGFETTLQRISDLSMDRIESITILKDAASAALYGSKAANGVVVVETKKPEAGRLRFSYNGNFKFEFADLRDYDLMNSKEKLEFERLSGHFGELDANGEPVKDADRKNYFEEYAQVLSGQDSYWMNEPLRNAFTSTHSLNAQGGDDAFQYGMTFYYSDTQGVMKGSDRDNVTGDIDLRYRVNKFNLYSKSSIGYLDSNQETVSFSNFARMNPFYKKYNDEGEPEMIVGYLNGTTPVYNPIWDLNQRSFNKNNQLSYTQNFNVEYTPIERLRIQGSVNFYTSRGETERFVSPFATMYAQSPDEKKGTYSQSHSSTTSYTARFTVNYGGIIGVHSYNLVGGASLHDSKSSSSSFNATGYTTDKFYNPNFAHGYTEGSKPSSTVSNSRNASFYFNANYSFDQRYLFDFNLSSDGASKFGINNPFYTSISVGGAWNIHNEKFFKNLFADNKAFSYMKIRYTYGEPGSDNFDAKLSNSVYKYYNSYSNPWGLATYVTQWGNTGLRWKRVKTHNLGLDLGFLDNKLMVNLNYHTSDSDPELMRVDMPSSTGTTSVPMNIGATYNKTFTFTVNYEAFRNRDMTIRLNANAIHTTTKYGKIGDLLEKLNEEGRASQTMMRYYDGASTSAIWAVRSAGIDPSRGDELFIKKDGTYTYLWDSKDEVIVGDMTPDMRGNFGMNVRYRKLSFNATFEYSLGGEKQLTTLMSKVENISEASLIYNQDRRALTDRWKTPGQAAKFKRINDNSPTNISSRFIKTENMMSLRSMSVGYDTTTAPFLRPLGLTSMNVRIYANDLFRFSTIKEERGLNYPFSRSFNVSLGLRF